MTAPASAARPRIVVLQVPWFDPERPVGGAEVVAAQIALGLASTAEVHVLHGWPAGRMEDGARRPRTCPGTSLSALAAFPIDDHVRHAGVIRPRLTDAARAALAAADVLVTIERVLDETIRVPTITCLGGSGYPHCHEVLRSGRWDRLVVPSASVLHELAPAPLDAKRVEVIPNGVDTALFAPSRRRMALPEGRHLRLLLPSRPGWEKGYRSALRLGRALQGRGRAVELICARQDGFLEVDSFYRQLAEESAGLSLRLLPWQGHRGMPTLYRYADLTLCLSAVPEGFGLAAAESVACGTPVLATDSGFLARLFPPAHGLHPIDPSAPSSTLAALAAAALGVGLPERLARGRTYVIEHYALRRMQQAYAQVVESLLTRWNRSPAGLSAVWPAELSAERQSPLSGHKTVSCDA